MPIICTSKHFSFFVFYFNVSNKISSTPTRLLNFQFRLQHWLNNYSLKYSHILSPTNTWRLSCLTWRSTSLVIRQKGKSKNGYYKKQSTANFPKNEHSLPPDTQTQVLCFLVTPALTFTLLPYCGRLDIAISYFLLSIDCIPKILKGCFSIFIAKRELLLLELWLWTS